MTPVSGGAASTYHLILTPKSERAEITTLRFSGAVLTAQVTALARPREADLAAEEQRRILRHDLRHYLHILSSCLRAGDGPAALQTMEAIRAGLRSAGLDEEVRHDQ